MNALTLQWLDAGQNKTQQIYEQQPSKNLGSVRIGRDPIRCDIVMNEPTVSGLHVEIFFHPQQQCFYIRNLRSPNPPLVDGKQLVQGEMPLSEGSIIYLGQMKLQVIAVAINSIPATILTPPQRRMENSHSSNRPKVNTEKQQHPPISPPGVYGLECPRCHRISPVENLQIGCHWCGTSLAAAVSVLSEPN